MSAKIILFGNQKGGVGKSTLTMMVANWLHNTMKLKVLVVDANTYQKSIFNARAENIENGVDESTLYPVLSTVPNDVLPLLENFIDDYDYIFIDVPGNLGEDGVFKIYLYADYVFVPTNFSQKSTDSTVTFLQILLNKIIPLRKENNMQTTVVGIPYMITRRGRNEKRFKQDLEEGNLPIPFFKTGVPYSEVFDDQSNTHDNITYSSKTFDIEDFYSEFKETLKI